MRDQRQAQQVRQGGKEEEASGGQMSILCRRKESESGSEYSSVHVQCTEKASVRFEQFKDRLVP